MFVGVQMTRNLLPCVTRASRRVSTLKFSHQTTQKLCWLLQMTVRSLSENWGQRDRIGYCSTSLPLRMYVYLTCWPCKLCLIWSLDSWIRSLDSWNTVTWQ